MAVTAPVFSSLWYRVGALRPCLAERVRIERQQLRGETWHLLIDPAAGRSVRLNRSAYALAGRLTGAHSLQQIWDAVCTELGDDAPTQDECIGVLARLHERGLLQCERATDFDAAYRQWREQSEQRSRPARNPLALRFTLGDPTRLLVSLNELGAWLFRAPVLVLWCACVALALMLAAVHWDALFAHAAKWLATPRYFALGLALYPLIKAVHELAHGLAIRRAGGEVRAWGITLLVALPVPFVDAAAAACLPRAYQRVLASAAGIMAELWIAALALMAWLALEPGLARDAAFVAAFIGAISTLAFNANPLLRFDGYHVLADALQLPNLASRSARYWSERLQALLGLPPAEPLLPAQGERTWLAAYAPLSWAYRIALAFAIVFWVGSHSAVLGVAVAALIAVQMSVPMLQSLRSVLARAAAHGKAIPVAGALAAVLLVLAAALSLVPAPFATLAQGVVWIDENAEVRAESDGFVAEVPLSDGAQVGAGDVVLVLRNPALVADADRLSARLEALETERFQALRTDAHKAQEIAEELAQTRAELERVEEKIRGLQVSVRTAGRLVLPRQEDLIERYVRKGEVLGHVIAPGGGLVRVAVPHADAAELQARSCRVSAQLAGMPDASLDAELVRDSRAATNVLPSAALSARNGGSILTDPEARDALVALDAIVVLDVRVPAQAVAGRAGQRAWVRFDFDPLPLARQWERRLRQALLRHFDPAG